MPLVQRAQFAITGPSLRVYVLGFACPRSPTGRGSPLKRGRVPVQIRSGAPLELLQLMLRSRSAPDSFHTVVRNSTCCSQSIASSGSNPEFVTFHIGPVTLGQAPGWTLAALR